MSVKRHKKNLNRKKNKASIKKNLIRIKNKYGSLVPGAENTLTQSQVNEMFGLTPGQLKEKMEEAKTNE